MVAERRRRGRRAALRRLARLAVPLVAVAVGGVLAVSAVAQIGPASGPYRRSVDRGYAALALPLVAASNAGGAALRSLVRDGPGLDRTTFFAQLDQLAGDATGVARRYDAITPPDPASAAAARCAAAMRGRAAAASALRSAFEDVLGGRTGIVPVDTAAVIDDVITAGTGLRDADAAWASCRRALRRAPGTPLVSRSVWLPDPAALDAATAPGLVGAVAASRSLAAVHRLVILSVVTDPAAVVSGQTLVIVPTTRLLAQAVVANEGNVDEDGVEVGGVAQLPGVPASPAAAQRTADIAAGGSTTFTLPAFAVEPGTSYELGVTAETPRLAGTGPIATDSVQVQVQAVGTLTVVTAPVDRVTAGRPVTFTADVTSSLPGVGTLTGTVEFEDDGAALAACPAATLHDGAATCTTSFPSAATHAISAAYSGDARFAGSTSPAITLQVTPG